MKVISFTVVGSENPFDKPVVSELKHLGVDIKIGKRCRVLPLLGSVWQYGRPKIVHLHWLSVFWYSPVFLKSLVKTSLFLLDLIIIKLLGIKLIWTVHNKHRHEKDQYLLDRLMGLLMARLTNKMIVYGKTARKEIKDFFQLKKTRKIDVVPHPHYINEYPQKVSESQAREKLGLLPGDFVFLFFGVIRPYKGVFELLEAFQKLKRPETKLIIAGLPLGEAFKKELSLALKKAKQTAAHLQFIPPEQVQIYFKAADVVVLPYRQILTSGSLLLALSFGKPVIAPLMGSIGDYLTSSGGFPYDPKESQALFKAMKKALKADLLKMSQFNLELAKKYSPKLVAQKLKKIYESL
jgi:beta-1,4-mannosyltransferase